MSHSALVPNDEGGGEDVSSLLRAVTDLGHRVLTAGNGGAEHFVLRDSVEEDRRDAGGGTGDDTLSGTKQVVAQGVVEEGLSRSTWTVEEEGASVAAVDSSACCARASTGASRAWVSGHARVQGAGIVTWFLGSVNARTCTARECSRMRCGA